MNTKHLMSGTIAKNFSTELLQNPFGKTMIEFLMNKNITGIKSSRTIRYFPSQKARPQVIPKHPTSKHQLKNIWFPMIYSYIYKN